MKIKLRINALALDYSIFDSTFEAKHCINACKVHTCFSDFGANFSCAANTRMKTKVLDAPKKIDVLAIASHGLKHLYFGLDRCNLQCPWCSSLIGVSSGQRCSFEPSSKRLF